METFFIELLETVEENADGSRDSTDKHQSRRTNNGRKSPWRNLVKRYKG